MKTISVSLPIHYTSASSKLINYLHNIGIRTIRDFLNIDVKTISELNVDQTTLLRLIRESIIINRKQIPVMYPINLSETIFIDFHWISNKIPRIWYIGLMHNYETNYFVNYNGLDREKYLLKNLEKYLSNHPQTDIILIPRSQRAPNILADRMKEFGLNHYTRVKKSITWSSYISSVLLWGYSTNHDELLQFVSQSPSHQYQFREYYDRMFFDMLRKRKQLTDIFAEVVQKSNAVFEEILNIIQNMILVY